MKVVRTMPSISGGADAREPPGPEQVATAFLTLLATNGADPAWLAASPAFRRAVSKRKWTAYVTASSLDRFCSASWEHTLHSGGNALLVGTVAISPATTLPANIQLEMTPTGWQVSRVDLKLAGAAYQAVQHLPE